MTVNVEGAFMTATFPSLQVIISLASVAEDVNLEGHTIRGNSPAKFERHFG
jgi:hypothetical protein